VLEKSDYTPQQLRKFLTPVEVQNEFGIDKDKLAYMRECSRDEGKLRGPMYLQDELIVLYQRKSVIIWINNKLFSSTETKQTQETQVSQQTTLNTSKVRKLKQTKKI
jgi:hypothetical protein